MNKASVDKKDRMGKSPEDYAMGDLKIKRALYPELITELKRNLYLAVMNNQLNDFKTTLEENPPVNFSITQSELGPEASAVEGETLLTLCIRRKQENFLRLLAQPKWELDVNQKNTIGESPLYLAKSLGFKNIEKLLLKLGALE
jgi:ankyrin repeat protein